MNHDPMFFEMQAQFCQSLGNTIRLQIIDILQEGPKPVNEIATIVGAPQPTVSRHLSILRSSGLLAPERRGTEVYYEITNPKVVEVCEMMRSILAERETLQFDLLRSWQD